MSFLLTLCQWMLNAQSQNYLERLFFSPWRWHSILFWFKTSQKKNCTWKEEPVVDLQVVLFFLKNLMHILISARMQSVLKTCDVARWLVQTHYRIPRTPAPSLHWQEDFVDGTWNELWKQSQEMSLLHWKEIYWKLTVSPRGRNENLRVMCISATSAVTMDAARMFFMRHF